MQRWKVGDVTVSAVLETMLEVPAELMIAEVNRDSVADYLDWLQPNYLSEDFVMLVAVQALLVESGGKRIVIDTCFGNDRDLPYPNVPVLQTGFLDDIAGLGFAREDVDVVLCTHMHYDHVGWNTMLVDGRWVPTFPDATYLFGREEYEHWQTHEDFNCDLTDSVEPVVAAGLHRFVETDHRITDEVRLVPTPGHTPGHVSVWIESSGEDALVTADLIHHPVQIVEPTWPAVPDADPKLAMATRDAILDRIADTDTLMIGTHFAEPCSGYIVREAGGLAWRPQDAARGGV